MRKKLNYSEIAKGSGQIKPSTCTAPTGHSGPFTADSHHYESNPAMFALWVWRGIRKKEVWTLQVRIMNLRRGAQRLPCTATGIKLFPFSLKQLGRDLCSTSAKGQQLSGELKPSRSSTTALQCGTPSQCRFKTVFFEPNSVISVNEGLPRPSLASCNMVTW